MIRSIGKIPLILLISSANIRVGLVEISFGRQIICLKVVSMRLDVAPSISVGIERAESVSLAGCPVRVDGLLVNHLHLLRVLVLSPRLSLLLLLVIALGVDLSFSLGLRIFRRILPLSSDYAALILLIEMCILNALAGVAIVFGVAPRALSITIALPILFGGRQGHRR